MSTATPAPVATPVSPKVLAGAAWSFLLPLLIVALLALIVFLTTDPGGQLILAEVPPVLYVPLMAFLSALGAAVGGYVKRDKIREVGAQKLASDAAAGVPNDIYVSDSEESADNA